MSRKFLSLSLTILLASCVVIGVLVPAGPAAAAPKNAIWYLPEGSTAWGFNEYIAIENPNAQSITVHVTYMTNTGPVPRPNIVVPATSRATLNPYDDLGAADFSTYLFTQEQLPFAVDRTMLWMGGPGSENEKVLELHLSTGVNAPAQTWYLPEGSTAWGFECWLLIQNPNQFSAAACDITFMPEGGAPMVFHETIPAQSRHTFNVADLMGARDASIKVTSDHPVIPERSMYRFARREGTCSVGATMPSTKYYLAEGTTAWGFTTYLLIQNPNSSEVQAQVTYLTPSGPKPQLPFFMDANSRKTIRVNDQLPDSDCSIEVDGSSPIIAERSMYWGGGTEFGEAAHDSIGLNGGGTTWYLPDGDCRSLIETWTLVENPNTVPVAIRVYYYSSVGAGPIWFDDALPAQTRRSYNLADRVSPGRYSIKVVCLTAGQRILAEGSMYYDTDAGGIYRTGGSNTIGGWEP